MTWQELLGQQLAGHFEGQEFGSEDAAVDRLLDLLGLEVDRVTVKEFACETWCDCGVRNHHVIKLKDRS